MLSRIRNSRINQALWGLLGIFLLNISVDTADFTPSGQPEDLTINDQESIVEIMVEKVLGYENAIPEHDEHDPEDHNSKTSIKIDVIIQSHTSLGIDSLAPKGIRQSFSDYLPRLSAGFGDGDTPPPRV